MLKTGHILQRFCHLFCYELYVQPAYYGFEHPDPSICERLIFGIVVISGYLNSSFCDLLFISPVYQFQLKRLDEWFSTLLLHLLVPVEQRILKANRQVGNLLIAIVINFEFELTIINENSSSFAPASDMYRSRLLITYIHEFVLEIKGNAMYLLISFEFNSLSSTNARISWLLACPLWWTIVQFPLGSKNIKIIFKINMHKKFHYKNGRPFDYYRSAIENSVKIECLSNISTRKDWQELCYPLTAQSN